MKKKIASCLVMIGMLGSLCLADNFVLTMSKDDDVCIPMNELFNSDLRYDEIPTGDRILFDKHPEFNFVKWEEKPASFFGAKYSQLKWWITKLDLLNDGKERILIKSESNQWDLYDTNAPLVVSFDGKYAKIFEQPSFSREHEYHKFSRENNLFIGERKLKELPGQYIYSDKDVKPEPMKLEVYNQFVFPTKVNEQIYITLLGLGSHYGYRIVKAGYDPMRDNNVAIIGKYNSKKELEHICYMFRLHEL